MKKAQEELAREKEREEAEKRRVMSERVAPLKTQGKSEYIQFSLNFLNNMNVIAHLLIKSLHK